MNRSAIRVAAMAAALLAVGCASKDGGSRVDASRSTLAASPSSVTADGAAAVMVVATAKDSSGTPISGVTATFAVAGTASLSKSSATTGSDGTASVTVTSTVAGEKRLTVSIDGVAVSAQATATFVAGPAAALLFATQPPGTVSGEPMAPAVEVLVHDAFGDGVTDATPVELTVMGGAAGAALHGTLTNPSAGGTATFADLFIHEAASGYQLQATSAGCPAVTSAPFDVTAGLPSPSGSTLLSSPASLPADGTTTALMATIRDAYGNPVSGATVTLSSSGAASLTQPASPTALDGTTSGSAASLVAGTVTLSAHVGATLVAQAEATFLPVYSVGGTVSGLTVGGLVLATPGLADLAVPAGATTFAFAKKVVNGTDYQVTVKTQPTGLTCNVQNASGTLAELDVTGVLVECTLAPVPLATFQPASVVIGQHDFWSGLMNQGGAVGADTLNYVYGTVATDGNGRLFVADTNNGRVLAYDPFPESNGPSADFALVQAGVSTGPSSFRPYMPRDAVVAGGKLLVNDGNNARVLIYDPVPNVTGATPGVVVGWADGSTPRSGCAQDALNHPNGMTVAAGKLIVADGMNHRVLIWNNVPSTSGAPADLVLGQKDFTHCAANDEAGAGTAGTVPTSKTLNGPNGVWSDGTRLLVADQLNNRVLVWNTFPTVSQTAADLVLGQAGFGSVAFGTSSAAFQYPASVASNGTQVVVSDVLNNRVLGWSSLPTSNGAPADFVLGQSDFGAAVANDDDQDGVADTTPSLRTLNSPQGVTFLPGRLVVADSHNFRFLVFQAP